MKHTLKVHRTLAGVLGVRESTLVSAKEETPALVERFVPKRMDPLSAEPSPRRASARKAKKESTPETSTETGSESEEDVVELEEEDSSKEPETEEEVTRPTSRPRIVTCLA